MGKNIVTPGMSVALWAVLAGGVWTAKPSAQGTDNPYTSRIDVRMGGQLFQAQCAGCHGLNATGSQEGGGPDLTTGEFRRASGDTGLFRVIRNGVAGSAMIGVGQETSAQSVWQLVTFLRSLEAPSAGIDLAGSPSAGEQLFTGKGDCARCHMVNGAGRRLGPDLSHVGDRRDPGELETDLVDPDADLAPRWWTMKVVGADGETVEGLRMNEDTFSFRIMDADENLRSFSKYSTWSYERVQTSTMPSYAQSLTEPERTDLVAYLVSLRRDQ